MKSGKRPVPRKVRPVMTGFYIKYKNSDLYCESFVPKGDIKVTVQIIHGMAEHVKRYREFAEYLTNYGVAVYTCDLPGHGKTLGKKGTKGFFAKRKGWDYAVGAVFELSKHIKREYPNVPHIVFGHSMGSFLARSYASRYEKAADAFIFCGTAGPNPALRVARAIASFFCVIGLGKRPSLLLNLLAFGSYNKDFKPAKTKFEWLSKNRESVDAYDLDPLCGFCFTNAGFRDLFSGLMEISDRDWAKRVDRCPILMISGMDDPVGGKKLDGVEWVHDRLKESGHDISLIEYSNCRHEILQEPEREIVFKDIVDFLSKYFGIVNSVKEA